MPGRRKSNDPTVSRSGTFIDAFAGCGGLSLGLMSAGWNGLFAVERDPFAFATLQANLIDGVHGPRYNWPAWLPQEPCEIQALIEQHHRQLRALRGQVDLISGGPPCQGFSLAGRRLANDHRNHLFRYYVDLVRRVKPALLLLENVRGIEVEHGKKERARKARATGEAEPAPVPFSYVIRWQLEELGYHVYPGLVRAVEYGVPQWRPRVVMIGVRKALQRHKARLDPFAILQAKRAAFLAGKGLPADRPVTVSEAISDLESRGKEIVACVDSPRSRQIVYTSPRTHYQRLLHGDLNGTAPNSLRLPNHADETRYRFWCILKKCRSGVQLRDDDLEWFGLKKHCIVPLDGDSPSHTLTTLPDDLLHYSEPRILTVRENARLQSFPDWYEFKGAYCTGGERRVQQCPRYTQVGNAVPPFLAEVLGLVLNEILGRVLPSQPPGSGEDVSVPCGEARCP